MLFRIVIAILLFAAAFAFVGVEELLATLAKVELLYIGLLLLVSVLGIWVSCMKWRLFLQAKGHNVGVLYLMRLYTVGYFFNTFFPSYVGGDVARSYELGVELDSQKDAFVATFLERFTGLVAMAALGVLFVFLGSDATNDVRLAILIVGLLIFVAAAVCLFPVFGDKCFALGIAVLRMVGLGKFCEKLESLWRKVQDAMDYARRDWALLRRAMLWSFAFHCVTVLNTYVAALAVGWRHPDVFGMFIVVPLVLLVSMVPITPSGLGLQEGAFLFFLQRIGGTKGESLGVGLVLRAKVMLVALVGGLLWVGLKKRRNSNANEPRAAQHNA